MVDALCVLVGFGSGVVIAGAIFAFIAVIGVVPRLAQKTSTERSVRIYEEAVVLGGIIGNCIYFFKPNLNIGIISVVASFFSGVFYGCVTVSLAEVLNVIPILSRSAGVRNGLPLFIFILALGKVTGSLMYFIIPGFKK